MEYEIYTRREGYNTDVLLCKVSAASALQAVCDFVKDQITPEMIVANGDYSMIRAVKVKV